MSAFHSVSFASIADQPGSKNSAATRPARSFPSSHFPQVTFDRLELGRILTVYGRMVAAGEWRDYALDFLDEVAVFSVFRHASEMPLFRIEKRPKLRAKQGQYSVVAAGGLILKRGQELSQVLKVFDKKLLKALGGKE